MWNCYKEFTKKHGVCACVCVHVFMNKHKTKKQLKTRLYLKPDVGHVKWYARDRRIMTIN